MSPLDDETELDAEFRHRFGFLREQAGKALDGFADRVRHRVAEADRARSPQLLAVLLTALLELLNVTARVTGVEHDPEVLHD